MPASKLLEINRMLKINKIVPIIINGMPIKIKIIETVSAIPIIIIMVDAISKPIGKNNLLFIKHIERAVI
jgi:hypothetical protein